MKLWAPDHPRGCAICLLDGRMLFVPCDKAGIEVPKEFRRAAITRGCVLVTEFEESKSDRVAQAVAPTAEKGGVADSDGLDRLPCQAMLPRGAAVDPGNRAPPETTGKTKDDHTTDATLHDRTADMVLRRLQQAGASGMTRTAIRDAFGRNRTGIGAALEQLRREGRATRYTMRPGRCGRPPEIWRATT